MTLSDNSLAKYPVPLVLKLLSNTISQIRKVDCNVLTPCCLFFPCLSVADHILHAAVRGVCDAKPGGLHPLLPERSAGQLPGRLSTGETNWPSIRAPLQLLHLPQSFFKGFSRDVILTSHSLDSPRCPKRRKNCRVQLWLMPPPQ